jgi:hypothetical protein
MRSLFPRLSGIFELIFFKQISGSTYIVACRHFGKCLPKIISIRFYFSAEKVTWPIHRDDYRGLNNHVVYACRNRPDNLN